MIDFKCDSHIHTSFSPDASPNATFQTYIKRAKELKLNKLIFTDHLDLDPGHPLFKKSIDYDEYIKEFNVMKSKSDLELVLGIEVGYQKHTIKQSMEIVKKYSFDYVILSVHYIDKLDFYTGEYYEEKTEEEAYNRYFRTCLEAIKNTEIFDAFGHLDYIYRYGPFRKVDYNRYKNIIDEILLELIKRDKTLEINTSGYKYGAVQYPDNNIIKRYIELGGQKLHIGSDAHRVSELGSSFDQIKHIFLKEDI